MIQQNIETLYVSVFIVIFPSAQPMSLVHTDMDIARRETFGAGLKHFFDQRIRFFFFRKQNVLRVVNVFINGIAKNLIKMRQRLYARHQFDPVFRGKRVDFFEFRF